MLKIQIRSVQLDDFISIYQLNKDELGYDYSVEATRDRISKLISSSSDKILVAIADDKIVGYIHGNDYNTLYSPHLKNIMGVAVHKDYRSKGIGKKLLAEIEVWAKETGARGIRLVSGETRKDAHEFYFRCGYSSEKKQLNFKKMFD